LLYGVPATTNADWHSSYVEDLPGSAYTFVSLKNVASSSVTVTIEFYSKDGTAVASTTSTVEPGEAWHIQTESGPGGGIPGSGALGIGSVRVHSSKSDRRLIPFGVVERLDPCARVLQWFRAR
jgi:hypothetical protein